MLWMLQYGCWLFSLLRGLFKLLQFDKYECRSKIFHIEPDGQRREFWQMKVVTRTRWFWTMTLQREQQLLKQVVAGSQCGKTNYLLSAQKKFRQINTLIISLVKTLLSRNFCKNKGKSEFTYFPHCANAYWPTLPKDSALFELNHFWQITWL